MHRIFFSTLIAVMLILVVLPTMASAESVIDRFLTGGHISFQFTDDSITDTTKFEAELELRLRHEDFTAFIRGTNDRPLTFQTNDFEVEKRGFNFELNDDWEISGGDYSLIFARGTVLNAVENRDVDRDAQLDGVLVEGDLGFADLTAFWGTHKSDNFEYYLSGVNTNEGGPSDELMGGRLEFDFNDLDLGISYVDAEQTIWDETQSTVMTEIDASWSIDNVDLYYETVWFNRDEPEGFEESLDGRAQVAEILYGESGFSISGTWVRYEDAKFDYGTAPSLRRPDIEEADARADDETGYRFDMRLNPDSWNDHSLRVLYADLNGIENENFPFKNYFIEWEFPINDDFDGSLSYDRIKGFQLNYGGIEGTDTSYRATIDGPFPFGGTFHFFGRYRLLKNSAGDDDEVELGLDWNISPDFTLGFFRETSTRPMEPPVPGLIDIPDESPGQWNLMFVRWAPDPWTQVELKLGSQRGGFTCAGGTCAQVPPFKGVLFTYYRNF